MQEQFIRAQMLLGQAGMARLAASHVAVFGLGGVGSWCAEALARSGVGALTLVDQDVVSPSNLNRQVQALHTTLGQPKAQAMAERVRAIAPGCDVRPLALRYEAETRERFFDRPYDYIVDAIDLVSCKLDLIETAKKSAIPIISALGTGNKRTAGLLRVADLSETSGCPLARIVRKELRHRGMIHHKVVFSPEEPLTPGPAGEEPPPGRRAIPGSVVWVTATAGLLLAGEVIHDLTGHTAAE